MPFIPRQVKPPTRIAVTCKLPQSVATVLKCYAEFLDSTQEYVVTEMLQLAFRKDREFQAWLTATHPEMARASSDAPSPGGEQAGSSPARVRGRAARPTRTTTPAAPAETPARPLAGQER